MQELLRRELLAMFAEIREMSSGLDRAIFTKTEAAHLLSCSISKLNERIRDRDISPVRWGGQWMVPRSEILRIATPTQRAAGKKEIPSLTLSRRRLMDGKGEAAKAREAMKRRRKR